MTLDQAFHDLQRLNESVPRPRRLPTPEAVDALAQSLGVQFHPDFRRFLLEASDVSVGYLEPVHAVPVEVSDAVDYTYLPAVVESAREWGVPDHLLPICEDNSDFYCMNDAGEVVFWSHDGTTDETWPDLAAWIEVVWIGGN